MLNVLFVCLFTLFIYTVYLHCLPVLLSTLRLSLRFVPANHRQLSLSILDQLCDWRWSHLLGKNVKVHSPSNFKPLAKTKHAFFEEFFPLLEVKIG